MKTRRMIPVCAAAACVAALSAAAAAQFTTITETFDGGSNEGNWTFGLTQIEVIQETGGNPGAWLYSPCEGLNCLDTFAPQPRTTPIGGDHAFTGDYRERGVNRIGIDLQTLDVDFSAGGRPLTIILVTDNGTPGDTSDDWGAYFVGNHNIPLPGEGWKSFTFSIPSQSETLPTGWQYITYGGSEPMPDWNVLVQNVAQVRFFYGDPDLFFIFQQWELGMDNPRITFLEEKQCNDGDVNCDGDVNVDDLLIVLNNWGKCADPEDCPADVTSNGAVNVDDLLMVLNNWG